MKPRIRLRRVARLYPASKQPRWECFGDGLQIWGDTPLDAWWRWQRLWLLAATKPRARVSGAA